MSNSLRSRLEKTPDEIAPPAPISRDRKNVGYSSTGATLVRTRDRVSSAAANAPLPKTEAEQWADHRWQRYKAEQAKEDRERQQQQLEQANRQRAEYEANRQQMNERALAEFNENEILTAIDDASDDEARSVGLLIKSKYHNSREPYVWEFALQEVRSQARARQIFGSMLYIDIEQKSDVELAQHLGCDVEFAKQLQDGHWYGTEKYGDDK